MDRLSDYPEVMINWAIPSDLDRVDHHRGSAEWVAGLWHAEDAKLLTLDPESRFSTNAGGSKLRMTKPFLAYDSQRHWLLGLLNGSPIFAVETLTDGEVHDFREVGFQLTDNERDIAATAAAITHWHRLERQCPGCGRSTVVINGGFARHCSACGRDNFPRTDPAVIVAVVDAEDRLLLGGQPTWGNRVSVLAGFVETGESLEQAIHREIGEEVDVSLSELRYFGSQPWPFPRSLMVAFFGRATGTDIRVDTDEIAHAEWYTRDQLTAKLDSGALGLPGNSSIASRMIQAWRAGEAPL
jgi:NAD+ diphosphatase